VNTAYQPVGVCVPIIRTVCAQHRHARRPVTTLPFIRYSEPRNNADNVRDALLAVNDDLTGIAGPPRSAWPRDPLGPSPRPDG
jgi:hypothetical protein